MRRDKEKILKELEAAVAKCNEIKQAMIDQLKVLEEKRKNYNIQDKVVILSIDDIDFNDDTISMLNRKINLLEAAIRGFKYTNYDFYKGPAKDYIDSIYKEVNGLDNKINNSLDEASRAIEEAENHMEYVKEVEVPTIKKEISRLLEPLREDVYGYWCDFSGTHLLERLKRKLEE